MMRLVTSYVNPDTDGVASALVVERMGWQGLHGLSAAFAGTYNAETMAVLHELSVPAPPLLTDFQLHNVEMLVDTHHPAQLPTGADLGTVRVIVDHHPGGQPECFPAARVLNELVGAAATLIAEAMLGAATPLTEDLRLLLAAGIASNTLDFAAPSTTSRDVAAVDALTGGCGLPPGLQAALTRGRQKLIAGTTQEVVGRDVKVFLMDGDTRVAVSQVEASGASALMERQDLEEALVTLKLEHEARFALINLADTGLQRSVFISWDEPLLDRFSELFTDTPAPSHMRWLPDLALRKTHVVPRL